METILEMGNYDLLLLALLPFAMIFSILNLIMEELQNSITPRDDDELELVFLPIYLLACKSLYGASNFALRKIRARAWSSALTKRA